MAGKKLPAPKSVEEFRDRFKSAPVGRWASDVDFGPFAVDVWEFRADGTGTIEHHSGAGEARTLFEWRPHAEREIMWRELEFRDEEGSDGEVGEWERLAYDFKWGGGQAPQIVMFTVPESALFKFRMTLDYLRFEGDIEDSIQP